jgi:hypothetical protein
VILDLIAEAKADGLPVKRACKVLGLSPRTVQRWKASLQPLPSLAATPCSTTGAARTSPGTSVPGYHQCPGIPDLHQQHFTQQDKVGESQTNQ